VTRIPAGRLFKNTTCFKQSILAGISS
jgi:hypothetical protein